MDYNLKSQLYKGIEFMLIHRMDYTTLNARQYSINDTKHTIWLKEDYVEADGTIIPSPALDKFLHSAEKKFKTAGVGDELLKRFI